MNSSFFVLIPPFPDLGFKPFIATLKASRNLWYMLVNEMWSGKLISEEVREPSIVHQAAQNVLLVDALMKRFV